MDVNPSHPGAIGQAVAGPIICRSCAPADCGVQAHRSRQHKDCTELHMTCRLANHGIALFVFSESTPEA